MDNQMQELLQEEQRLKNAKLRLECLAIARGMQVPDLMNETKKVLQEVKVGND